MLTLFELIDGVSRTHPTGEAVLGAGSDPLTYEKLVVHLRQGAARLAGTGLRRNQRVAIVLPNGPEMACAFLAVSAVATSAPLNPAYSPDEFRFYLSDLGAKALVTSAGCAPAAVAAAAMLGIPVIWLRPDAASGAGAFKLDVGPIPATGVELAQADDVALVLHTSGTTARPKIVPLTQRNLVESAHHIARSLKLTAGDRCLNIMPLFHVHGLVGAVLSSLAAGAAVVCTPGFHADGFFGWLAEFAPTWFTAVPTMHQVIVSRAASSVAGHRLRFIRSCSSALAPKVMAEIEKTFGVPVIEALGMTEAAHQVSSNPLPPGKRKPGSVGVAAGPEVAVMNETGDILPADMTGEIVIRGGSIMRGYENNEKSNAASFAGPWFRTGDQGYMDGEGYVFLTGRIKEIINRGGEKISPREIDEILLDCPGVAQAVAFAMPDSLLGEQVAAAVVLRAGTTATGEEIRRFAATRLAHFKVPARVIVVDEIPKGPTGKLQRSNLAQRLGVTGVEQGRPPRPQHVAPATAVEAALVETWERVLAAGPVGLHDNVFDLGANSIAVTQVAARLRQALNVEVPLADFYVLPTPAKQSALVESLRSTAAQSHDEIRRLLVELEGMSDDQARKILEES